jgi:hypothetical protein
LLGPSAAQPPLPGTFPLPVQLGLDPSPWLVSGLLLGAVALGIGGLILGLRALAAGWRLDPRRTLAAGTLALVAMVVVPPMGSADVLVYAAYGRLTALGENAYTMTADDLAALGDPVGRAVEPPWQDTPSIYGPAATGEQWLASKLGGDSPQATVWWLAFFTALGYAVTGLLLLRLAAAGAARSRVLLLWWLNPLLLYEVVNGAHLDGLGIAFAVGALALLRRSPLGAGVLAGVAVSVKLSFGLYALALAWGLRRSPRGLMRMAGAAAVVFAAAYAAVGLHALDQARSASRLVSLATPARLLVDPLESVLPNQVARDLIAALGWLAFVAVAACLGTPRSFDRFAPKLGGDPALVAGARESIAETTPRVLPDKHARRERRLVDVQQGEVVQQHPRWLSLGSRRSVGPTRVQRPNARSDGDPLPDAVRAAALLSFAWLLTATYSLPWYDVVAWAPFALLAAGRYDWLLIGRTAVLAVGYIPGRVVDLPPALDAITRNLRGTVGPFAGIALLVLAVMWARSRPPPAPPAPAPG